MCVVIPMVFPINMYHAHIYIYISYILLKSTLSYINTILAYVSKVVVIIVDTKEEMEPNKSADIKFSRNADYSWRSSQEVSTFHSFIVLLL